MNENSAGSAWRMRRESMGKSIEDVSASLRVSRRYLHGIEEGCFDGWPDKVFSSGFIRSYAKYLSVDPAPVLEEYEAIQKRFLQPENETVRPEWMERSNRSTSYIVITASVFFVGLMLAFFTMRSSEKLSMSLRAVKIDTDAPVSSGDKTASPDAVTSEPVHDAATTNKATPAGTAPETASKAPESHIAVSSRDGSVPVAGPQRLLLEATDNSWLMYSLDGGAPVDVTLVAGDRISIQAEKTIYLKLGNAGGLVGTLNGQRLAPFGKSGQVREFTLGR
jgi:cytoskeletal protein RodZ